MSFKDMVEADIKNVFLNADEFSDIHTVIYDGETFSEIPVLLTQIKESDRSTPASDHAEGLYLVSAVAHIAMSDIGDTVPEKGQEIQIDDGTALGRPFFRTYKIITSDCTCGMAVLELGAIDE